MSSPVQNNTNPQQEQNKWNKLSPPVTSNIRQKLMNIGESIWYCTDYDTGKEGIVEYDTINHKFNVIQYSQDVGYICNHSCCNDGHLIYIVDGHKGNLVMFNTKSKQFGETIKIPKIGGNSTSIMFNQQLHIFGGSNNDGKHIVFNPMTKQLKMKKDFQQTKKMSDEHIIIHNNQIIRFGGFDCTPYVNKQLDHFVIGNINTNNNNDYQWINQQKYKLPKALTRAGYILYNDYLIIFGGETPAHKSSDNIYILNLNESSFRNKWIKSNIKCPTEGYRSWYQAILMKNGMVHIFKCFGCDVPYHCDIHISSILGNLYQVNNNGIDCDDDKKENGNDNDDDNENDNDDANDNDNENDNDNDDAKCNKCEALKQKTQKLSSQISIKDGIIQSLNDVIANNEKLNTETKDKFERIQQQKYNEMNEANIKLKKENEKLTENYNKMNESNIKLNEECKELHSKLTEMKAKYNKLYRKINIKESEYMSWNSDNITDWIISLDPEYEIYEEILRKNLSEEQVDGELLGTLDKNDIHRMGIKPLKHKNSIIDHIKRLTTKKQQLPQNDERNKPTVYI
eukprot:397233_1